MISSRIAYLLLLAGVAITSARNIPHGSIPDGKQIETHHQVHQLPSYARVSRNTDGQASAPQSGQVQQAEERMGLGGKKGGLAGFGFEGNGIDLTVGPAMQYAKYYYNPFAYGGPYSPPVFVPMYGPLPNLESPGLSLL